MHKEAVKAKRKEELWAYFNQATLPLELLENTRRSGQEYYRERNESMIREYYEGDTFEGIGRRHQISLERVRDVIYRLRRTMRFEHERKNSGQRQVL